MPLRKCAYKFIYDNSRSKKFLLYFSQKAAKNYMSLEVDKLIEEFLVESSLVLNAKLMPLFHLK